MYTEVLGLPGQPICLKSLKLYKNALTINAGYNYWLEKDYLTLLDSQRLPLWLSFTKSTYN